MKANEFVKEFGLDTFRLSVGFVSTRKYLVVYEDEIDFTDEIKPSHGKCVFDRSEVQRLVVSHDLVEKWQGLEASKIKVNLLHTFGFHTQADQLQQAITDVESCMEVKSDS